MKQLVILLLLSPSIRTLAQAGSISLFNGKNLDGWVIESDGEFEVVDGALRINRGTGWLRSRDRYGDFTLVMEFRFLEEGANSGIFVRTLAESKDDENGWPVNGYQIQCMDTIEGDTPLGSMINYGGPETEDIINREALEAAYRAAGEWHRHVIHCEGDDLTVILNGKVVTRSSGLGNSPSHIGIQGEHGLLEFRRIDVVKH